MNFCRELADWTHRTREVAGLIEWYLRNPEYPDGEAHKLQNGGVQVYFTTMPNHPQYMKVRGFNWKCEDEPSGVYPIDKARELWTSLKRLGFQEAPVDGKTH